MHLKVPPAAALLMTHRRRTPRSHTRLARNPLTFQPQTGAYIGRPLDGVELSIDPAAFQGFADHYTAVYDYLTPF